MHTAKVHRKWHPEAGNKSYLLEAAGEKIWKHINTQGKQVSTGIAKEILLINWQVMFFLFQCGRERLLSVHVKWSCQCPHESRSSSKRAPWNDFGDEFGRKSRGGCELLIRNFCGSKLDNLMPSEYIMFVRPRYVSSSTLASLCQLPGSCVEMPGLQTYEKT